MELVPKSHNNIAMDLVPNLAWSRSDLEVPSTVYHTSAYEDDIPIPLPCFPSILTYLISHSDIPVKSSVGPTTLPSKRKYVTELCIFYISNSIIRLLKHYITQPL